MRAFLRGSFIIFLICLFLWLAIGSKRAAGDELGDITKPCGVPYECVSDYKLDGVTLSWKLLSDRAMPAYYSNIWWKAVPDPGRGPKHELRARLRTAGKSHSYRIFERQRHRVWWSLWLVRRGYWQEVAPGSGVYNQRSAQLIGVLSIASFLRQHNPPGSLPR